MIAANSRMRCASHSGGPRREASITKKKCPKSCGASGFSDQELTFDYGFFRSLLADTGVGTVALGGTAIGDAIRKAIDAFKDEVRNYKAIILITDGEDGRTTREGVYAGGDAVTGAATVIKAMGAGKEAATAIDAYIRGKQ